jgi:hypothetical protein
MTQCFDAVLAIVPLTKANPALRLEFKKAMLTLTGANFAPFECVKI